MMQNFIRVGLIEEETESLKFQLSGEYEIVSAKPFAVKKSKLVRLSKNELSEYGTLRFISKNRDSRIKIYNVRIGKRFHWEQTQTQIFRGNIEVSVNENNRLQVINEVPIEEYVLSVISSEMSANSPLELLKAHSIIARSWAINQIQKQEHKKTKFEPEISKFKIIRIYTVEEHTDFDVCADDHCQRYQGIKNITKNAEKAVKETEGLILKYNNKTCDCRFSKCCGGITENYSTCWEDIEVPYLTGIVDGINTDTVFPIDTEARVKEFILSNPASFCNFYNKKYLPSFDKRTKDYFRWKVIYDKAELERIIKTKTEVDIGELQDIIPLKRGISGRLSLINIIGSKQELQVGKELEIRRVLSKSHLYSSCFICEKESDKFIFYGAGWGHGVGLCQIGALNMALKGYSYKKILSHYYKEAVIDYV